MDFAQVRPDSLQSEWRYFAALGLKGFEVDIKRYQTPAMPRFI